ncbi:MAG: Lrp/AsnC ligand binding domain-containing protein [Candidatus Bathyarchaeia archaeon]|nr:Lrp/AsnC ligand binding domain-containing protein [Candidatus Bathyarchaeota archaeon]
MTIAYILINVESGSEADVSRALRGISEVKEVYGLYGLYDLIAKIEVDSVSTVRDVVSSKMRALKGVRSTLTMIVVE